jgi:ligand-binding sensor domain-containing protein/signal transduction histidine kinase
VVHFHCTQEAHTAADNSSGRSEAADNAGFSAFKSSSMKDWLRGFAPLDFGFWFCSRLVWSMRNGTIPSCINGVTLLIAAALVEPFDSSAQKLPFKNYSTKEGLVQNEARCIFQDSRGYLWIGTTEGISRFDGATFTKYELKSDSTADRSEPPVTFVNRLFEDKEGSLWIGLSFSADLARFNYPDQSFSRYKIVPNPLSISTSVNTILQGATGALWFGTDDGLFIFENGRFHRLAVDTTNSPLQIQVLYEDRQHTLWIATSRGLFRYGNALGVRRVQIPNLSLNSCNAICEDRAGNLWIGTDDCGLTKLEKPSGPDQPPSHATIFTTANGLPSNSVHDILQDDAGTLWIATWGGLSKFNPGTQELVTYTTANGLPSDNLYDVLQDRERNLWLATTRGISKLAGETFANYGKSDGLPTEFLKQVVRGGNGALWLAGDGGACRLAGGVFIPVEAVRGKYVSTAMVDRTGTVWFGTHEGVVKWAHGKVVARYTTRNGLPDNHIHSIFQDSRGGIWFGHEKGASRLWRGVFRHFRSEVENPLVIAMTEDKNGTIWFATFRNGVYRLSSALGQDSSWEKVNIPIGFRTRAIYCDKENKIWIGTRLNGAFRYDPQTGALTNYTTAQGLSSNFVHGIFQDRKDNFWLGTNRGVSRFDGTSFRQYSTFDGLAGDVVFAGTEDGQGNLWFATNTGASRYDPVQDRYVSTPPPVYVTKFRIFGKEVPLREGTNLAASQHSVSLEYVGISFKDETQVRYQYRLLGLDKNWSEVMDRRYVNYTNLSAGRYTFEVRARNADGVWSFQPAVFSFRIAAPLWRKWWFVMLVVAAVAAAVIGLHRHRVNRLLEIKRVRSRIATDLHDEIGTSLSSVALFSEMTRRDIQAAAPKVAERLKGISETAQELVETMRDIVWSIDPARDSLEDVVLYMKQFAAEVLEAKDIEFAFVVTGEFRGTRLPMEMRHHLFLIFKEALTNLVRHSGSCHADIQLRLDEGKLLLEIRDNGRGFDPCSVVGGNGLRNMNNRARSINGTLSIDSAPGKGTKIALEIAV